MQLESMRLVLRDFRADDWQAVHAYRCDPRYLTYYPDEARSPDDARRFVEARLTEAREVPRRRYQLAITLRPGGRLIGTCGVRVLSSDPREADFGCELSPRHWGLGYAREATIAITDFGFRELGLRRLWAECIAANRPARRLVEALGFAPEEERHTQLPHYSFSGETQVYAVSARVWSQRANAAGSQG